MGEPSDAELMAQVRGGDRAAFATLVHRHVDALYGYALRLTRSAADAEDLVQDTMLTLWRKAASYNARKAQLNTWLFHVLHNRSVDLARRQRLPIDDGSEIEQLSAGDAAAPDSAERYDRLLRQIDALPLAQRSAIALAHLRGLSNREVAQIMNISVRAVESLLARARAGLREALAREQSSSTPK